MKLFEETDYSSYAAVSNTVNKYGNMMSPIYLAFGDSNRVLPEYQDSATNETIYINIYRDCLAVKRHGD